MINIIKIYGLICLLCGVNFELVLGEVLGLVGDNGVGKFILIKVFFGVVIFFSGMICIDGEQ